MVAASLPPCESGALVDSHGVDDVSRQVRVVQSGVSHVPSPPPPSSLTLWTAAAVAASSAIPSKFAVAPQSPVVVSLSSPHSPRFVADLNFGKMLCFKSPQDSPILDEALSLYWSTFSSTGVDVPPFMARALLDYGVYRVYVVMDASSHVLAVALVVQMIDLNSFHLDYICTDPKCRGNGLGSAFFKALVSDLQCDCPVFEFMTLQCQNHLLNWYLKLLPKGAMRVETLDDVVSPTVTFHFVVAPLVNADCEKEKKDEKANQVFERLNETIWSKALEANQLCKDKIDHGLESRQEMLRFLGLCSGKDNH